MAAPEVTGGVTLLWQANPSLGGNVDATLDILEQTATHTTTIQNCGGSGLKVPNNVYGYGMLNLLPAVQQAKKFK
jgi:subtilisin family serine protease